MKNYTTFDDSTLLQEIHRGRLMAYLPAIILLIVLAILGIVGNSFTIRFYSAQRKKSSTFALIQYLGVIDLIVCVLSFSSVAVLAVNVCFTTPIWCKLQYFFTNSFILTSILVLWIITIDRYLKVCRPQGRQLATRLVLPIVLAVVIFSMALSTCDFLRYDVVQVALKLDLQNYAGTLATQEIVSVVNMTANNDTNKNSIESVPVGLYGHYCTITESTKVQHLVKMVHGFELSVTGVVLLTFMIVYGKILQASLKNSKRRACYISNQTEIKDNSKQMCTKAEPKESIYVIPEKSTSIPNIIASTSPHTSNSYNTHSLARGEIKRMTDRNTNIKKRKRKSTENNISAMMATVTLGFVLSFIPYFIVAGIRTLTKTSESELSALHQLALRSPYLNSVINPIIFCIFNPRYRRYIMRSFINKIHTEKSTPPQHETNRKL